MSIKFMDTHGLQTGTGPSNMNRNTLAHVRAQALFLVLAIYELIYSFQKIYEANTIIPISVMIKLRPTEVR